MRKFIPVEEVAKEWMKDPAFVAGYDALEDEFARAAALIKARESIKPAALRQTGPRP